MTDIPHKFRAIPLYDANGENPLWTDWCAFSVSVGENVCGKLESDSIHHQPMVMCEICGQGMATVTLLEHLQDIHQIDEVIQVWPDGKPVVVDMTLEPKDFV